MKKPKNSDKLLSLIPEISTLSLQKNLETVKNRITGKKRYLSLEQAALITESYRQNTGYSRAMNRALGLKASLEKISISISPDELLPGNRTAGVRDGVVFPEAGIEWLKTEIETLPEREQDRFQVKKQDTEYFYNELIPFWENRTLEDYIRNEIGEDIDEFDKVVKINQRDHAQGHIIPHVESWIRLGPSGLAETARINGRNKENSKKSDFFNQVDVVLTAASVFMLRYGKEADAMALLPENGVYIENLREISRICRKLSVAPPETFREAVQSLWFLFVILQMESNASSFSPGRMDQYLFPFLKRDLEEKRITLVFAQEILESLFLNFNKIVYMRNKEGARYFAGFPIGFNISIGGQLPGREDGANALSYMMLKAQEHLGLPQPNLTARLHSGSSEEFIDACSKVIGQGSGMPQIVNDESIIPALQRVGISREDAEDYALVGCVELSTPGNNLGWSDAAMFNLLKALELTINNGKCLLTKKQIGPDTGNLCSYTRFMDLEEAFRTQLDFYIDKMIRAAEFVDRAHANLLPSPFLSSVVYDCLKTGVDVTEGGAKYNLSGIQAIQPANIADSLAVIKELVYDRKTVNPHDLLDALRQNWKDYEELKFTLTHLVPKYGNDIQWVDGLAARWCGYFAKKLDAYTNIRGGKYHMGLYTVSAHVPMGRNVGASPDGRTAQSPLADGGVSPTYGRDKNGPTSVLKSVSRLDFSVASNGTLLNMKFLPSFFTNKEDRKKFNAFLRVFIKLGIHHIQFNVVNRDDLIKAQENPEAYSGLTIRVAGYTAYFTELARDLQNEIINRTAHGV